MPDYTKGKIYKIYSPTKNLMYIGSTTRNIAQRMAEHVSHFKRYKNGKGNLFTSFKILECEDYKIELIENYPCNNSQQLTKKEGEHIKILDCVNKKIEGRTEEDKKEQKKEYIEANKEVIKEYQKEWREANKEVIKEQRKEYYKDNKEVIKEANKEYREANKEQRKEYREANKERIKEQNKEYREANKERIKEQRKQKKEQKKEQTTEQTTETTI
jgi:hypothetical protein